MLLPGLIRRIVAVSGALFLLPLSQAQSASAAQKPATGSTSKPASHSKTSSPTHHATSTTAHKSSHKRKSRRTASWRRHGQQKIDPQRAREIQEALIRQHYLSGEPTGVWDATTQKAMEKYQADNGWQDKSIPDSRALIKLGLGPDHAHLLNPESAMTSGDPPAAANAAKADTALKPAAQSVPAANPPGPSVPAGSAAPAPAPGNSGPQ